jgi:hypothetical protein
MAPRVDDPNASKNPAAVALAGYAKGGAARQQPFFVVPPFHRRHYPSGFTPLISCLARDSYATAEVALS